MTDPLSALRQAAAALLAEAPMPVVRGMLRALLADTEAPLPTRAEAPASARQSQESQRPESKPASTPAPKPKRTPPQPDSAWDERRVQIRTAMRDRNVSFSDLAAKFRVSVATLRHALHRRQAPGPAMKRRLDGWMKSSAPAPAVAAEPPPFRRSNGASGSHAGHSGAAAVAD